MNERIEAFIKRFDGAQDVFLHGCCYWFAWILAERFKKEYGGTIVYEPVEGHFLYIVNEPFAVYDIRGNVTGLYAGKEVYNMLEVRQDSYYNGLMRDCRDFIEDEY